MTVIACDCSCDLTDYDDPPKIYEAQVRKCRKPRKCCECGDPILPGQHYERVDDLSDDGWSHYDTCMPCLAIRKWYCAHGWIHGDLASQILDCIEFDYRQVPEDDE